MMFLFQIESIPIDKKAKTTVKAIEATEAMKKAATRDSFLIEEGKRNALQKIVLTKKNQANKALSGTEDGDLVLVKTNVHYEKDGMYSWYSHTYPPETLPMLVQYSSKGSAVKLVGGHLCTTETFQKGSHENSDEYENFTVDLSDAKNTIRGTKGGSVEEAVVVKPRQAVEVTMKDKTKLVGTFLHADYVESGVFKITVMCLQKDGIFQKTFKNTDVSEMKAVIEDKKK